MKRLFSQTPYRGKKASRLLFSILLSTIFGRVLLPSYVVRSFAFINGFKFGDKAWLLYLVKIFCLHSSPAYVYCVKRICG